MAAQQTARRLLASRPVRLAPVRLSRQDCVPEKRRPGRPWARFSPAGEFMHHDPDVAAVVVGFDRYINYYKIQYATLCIYENPGCQFIATNTDAVTHLTDAQARPR